MKKRRDNPKKARNIIFFLDVFLSLAILFFTKSISQTNFGKATIIFAFTMILIALIFRILKRW